METLQTILYVVQVLVGSGLILFVLIQHGKGADAGAAFGSGASATVFGSRGSGNFLTRTTAVLAIIFLGNSLVLGYLATEMVRGRGSLLDEPAAESSQPESDLPPVAPGGSAAVTAEDQAADVPVIPGTAETPTTSEVPEQ
jgi:protein translocase, SecG subunit